MNVEGTCDTRFSRLRDAFAGNFARLGEPGAAIALSVDGRMVADLWGGYRDAARTLTWQRDTLVNVFSVSKALCAIAILREVERGRVDLDAPVAALWPEFGKESVTPRLILSHRAGLPSIREPLPDGAALDWPRMIRALEAQDPWWEPGTAHGYHVNTFGFLIGEIVRRVTGKTIGTVLREEIAGPVGADVHIGLPREEHHRVAEFLWPATPSSQGMPGEAEIMRFNAYWNPPGISGGSWVNRPAWRLAEVPSTNGHATARGIAKIYAALLEGRLLAAEILRAATTEQARGHDLINQRPSRFGLGFQLTQPERPLGPNAGAFGHFGAGGSLGFCDPEARIAFGYVTGEMGPRWQNPRNRALLDAIYACL